VFGCASRTRPSSERDEAARNYIEDACQGYVPIFETTAKWSGENFNLLQ
jgi:hypothetical protein